jgi:hypothetical protein
MKGTGFAEINSNIMMGPGGLRSRGLGVGFHN